MHDASAVLDEEKPRIHAGVKNFACTCQSFKTSFELVQRML